MKRKLFLVWFCYLLGSFIGQAAAQDVVKIILLPGTQLFPIMTMEKQGIDKKYNLVLEKRKVVSVSALYTSLRAGEVDVGFGAWISIALFRSKGAPLTNVYSMYGYTNDVLVKADSPLKSFTDLKGKRVGLFGGPAAGTTALFRLECIKFFGFDPLKESKIQFGAPPLLKGLVAKGEVDAALLLDPIIVSMLETGKYRSIGNIGDIYREKTGQQLMLVSVVANENFAKKNPDAVKRFVKAYKESVLYIKSHPEIWSWLAKAVRIKTDAGARLLKNRVEPKLLTRWDEAFIQYHTKFGQQLGATLGKRFWPGVSPGTFSLEFAPR